MALRPRRKAGPPKRISESSRAEIALLDALVQAPYRTAGAIRRAGRPTDESLPSVEEGLSTRYPRVGPAAGVSVAAVSPLGRPTGDSLRSYAEEASV